MSKMRHIQSVHDFIEHHGLLGEQEQVLVGLSGGIDSIVLTDILLRLGHRVSAVHLNYQLRGEASDADEEFVRTWCERRHLLLRVRSFETQRVAAERNESVQETARFLRYDAIADLAADEDIPVAAVGHHRDDQAETVLLNLFRGSGPEGLAGMPVSRSLRTYSIVRLIRPLLCLSREDVEAHAVASGLEWREDASNLTSAYRRGALRGYIIPKIEEHFGPAVRTNIARSADLMREYVEGGLDQHIRETFESAASECSDGYALDIDVLRSVNPVLRRRVILEGIRRWLPELGGSRATAGEVDRLLDAQPGRRLAHPSGEIWRERRRLLFQPAGDGIVDADADAEAAGENTMPLTDGSAAETPVGSVLLRLDVDRPPVLEGRSPNREFVDADGLKAPLVVRRWRSGDRFVPLGMEKEKKISDFLTDVKIPPHLKAGVHVVEAGGEIVWVVGHRIAASVRVRPDTRRIAEFRFHPAENTSTLPA
jgi:tRNA(Ile)-lysidine synthase